MASMRLPFRALLLLIAVGGLSPFAIAADLPDAQGIAFFESKIRPVLVEHCYKCHATTSEKLKANLKLDTLPNMLKGGDSGPALVPSDPDKSRLIEALLYKNE